MMNQMNNDIQTLKSKISMIDLMRKLGFRDFNKTHARCILHADGKTMSFSFNEDFFHCFGCNAKGDKIGLVKNALCVDFKGAVEFLSKETGFYPNVKLNSSKIDHKKNMRDLIAVQKDSDKNFELQYIIDKMEEIDRLRRIWTNAIIKIKKSGGYFDLAEAHLNNMDEQYGFLKYQRSQFWAKM